MKRKIFFAAIICLFLVLCGSAFADFGGFSGSHSSSSRRTSRNHLTRPGSITNTPPWYFAVAGAGIFGLLWFGDAWYVKWKDRRKFQPMRKYRELDPNFDEDKIKRAVSDLYFHMQETWQTKDISRLKSCMTDEFYAMMDKRLNYFREDKQTDHTENILVNDVALQGWRQSDERDFILVELKSQIVSYVSDDTTGELISGDKSKKISMEYEIEISRKSGTITGEKFDWSVSNMDGHRQGA